MSGQELYNSLSKRDYSNSEQDQYAQFLSTLFQQIFLSGEIDKFFNLLEEAHLTNKKLDLLDHSVDEYFVDNITLV